MRKKVIWLCSWYPNDTDEFTGDFIQRQAIAASIYSDIEVIHVAMSTEDKCVTHQLNPYLRETIYYTKSSTKLLQYKDFFLLHESFISDYLKRKGKPDLIHVHIPIRSGMVALRWKRNYNWPYLVTEHYGIYNHHVKDRFAKRNYFFRYFTRRILQLADAFLPVSQFLGQCVNEFAVKKKYTTVPNVVDTSLFHVDNPTTKQVFRFIHVSDGSDIKNVGGLLKAVAKLYAQYQEFELYIIGNTNPKHEKAIQAKSWNKKVVHFLPIMSYVEVAQQVRQADAGVLFSLDETQSCAVLEWLCAGKPVVASAVGGVSELITPENGLLVESNDVDQLADAMLHMIHQYTKYNPKAIAQAAAQQYSYDAVALQLKAIYNTY